MYEFQRRLINEATKFGQLSPKEKENLPKDCLNEEIVNLGEGISAMGGAQKATVAAGLSVSIYRNLLNRLLKFPGHALVLDITTPTGPGAARGGLSGEGSEIKVVKIADIGKYELMGYKFPSVKPGVKAERSWKDHKGEATILAINESVNEASRNDAEFLKVKPKPFERPMSPAAERKVMRDVTTMLKSASSFRNTPEGKVAKALRELGWKVGDTVEKQEKDYMIIRKAVRTTDGYASNAIAWIKYHYPERFPKNESVEDLHEFDSEFKQNAKHNLAMSTKLAKKKNADHDSQWGVGFRAYCRAVISGNAVNMDQPKEPGLKSGWNDARQMLAMGRRLKEEVENLEESAPVKASKSQIEDFKNKVSAYYTARARKQKNDSLFMSAMYGGNIVAQQIDDWVKETGGDVTKLPSYFLAGSKDKTKFEIRPVNDFVKSVFGNFKLMNTTLVKEEVEDVSEAIPTAVSSGFRTGVVDGKTNEIVFHGTKPQAMSAMKKLNGKNLKRYFLASLTPKNKLGGKWSGGTPSWVKAESVENLGEASMTDLINKMTDNEAEVILLGKVPSKFKGETLANLKIAANKVMARYDLKRRQAAVAAHNRTKKEEVEDVSEASVKDEMTGFLLDLPKPAANEIAQLSKKMGGLKANTTTETAIKTILTKHRVKLLRDMATSVKAIINFFDDMEESVQEAFAPQWAHNQQKKFPIMGEFKHNGKLIQYRKIGDGPGSDWAKSHGMTHEIFLQPVWNDHRDTRFAIIKGTVAIIATDEGPGGKPMLEKWPITSHRRFPDHPSNPTGYTK